MKTLAAAGLIVLVLAGCGSSGKTTSTQTVTATTSTTTAITDAAAAPVCARIIQDSAHITDVSTFGQYGNDIEKLMPLVNSSDTGTVITAVGHVMTVLKDISTGANHPADVSLVAQDAQQIGALCGRIIAGH